MHIPFQFENKGTLILGIFHVANQQLKDPIVLIMCYGLNGNRVVENRISVKLGEFLENNGINLVRFDYRNVGVSEGCFEYSSIEDRVSDIIEVCKYVKSCFYDKMIKIILIGFSDGARNAIQAINRVEVDGLILWNPIFNVPLKSNNRIELSRNKFILHPLYKIPIKKLLGVGLNHKIIKQIDTETTVNTLENYVGGVLLLFGDNDDLTKDVRAYLTSKNYVNNRNVNYAIIKNANHLFNRSICVKELFDITLEWLFCNFN